MPKMFTFCPDIGMFANSRPRFDITAPDGTVTKGSCNKVATDYCKKHCYNVKLEKAYSVILRADIINERTWQNLSGAAVAAFMKTKRKFTARIRGMTRGENFSTLEDVWRWREIALENSSSTFWLPTHAWWDPEKSRVNLWMILAIERDLMTLPNVRVLASVDPSNEPGWREMEERGWGVMYFGDNKKLKSPSGLKAFPCPKTHKKMKGHCAICVGGCFDKNLGKKRFVLLRKH